MSEAHKKYHFSVTLQTQDAAVLHCLRALSQYCEQGKYKQITWGGTKQVDWKKRNGIFTVRFTQSWLQGAIFSRGNAFAGRPLELCSAK